MLPARRTGHCWAASVRAFHRSKSPRRTDYRGRCPNRLPLSFCPTLTCIAVNRTLEARAQCVRGCWFKARTAARPEKRRAHQHPRQEYKPSVYPGQIKKRFCNIPVQKKGAPQSEAPHGAGSAGAGLRTQRDNVSQSQLVANCMADGCSHKGASVARFPRGRFSTVPRDRWSVDKSTVSRWLASWENDRLVNSRRSGKERPV